MRSKFFAPFSHALEQFGLKRHLG